MRRTILLAPLAVLGTALAWPLAAAAQDRPADHPGLYLGGGAGYNRIEGEDFTGNGDEFEDSRISYKGILGLRLTPTFFVEGQYINFGTAEDGANRVKADGFTTSAVLDLPIWEFVHPYGKIGALFWDADGRFSNVAASDDGTDLTYGVGLRFAVTERIDLRTEYERFELNDTDIDMASANLQFNF